jgi:AAA family ATP:ADP antiporter
MTSDAAAPKRIGSHLLTWLCWIVIAAFAVTKAGRLLQGAPLAGELDLDNPTPLGIAATLGVFVLLFKSPKVLRSATMIEAGEARNVVLSFVFVFVLMASYYTLRPVRDAMASDWSNTEISVLWNIQLLLSTLVVALYGWACSRVPFKWLVPAVYVFFGATFIGFYFGSALFADRELIDKAFYIWVTLFSLLHLSVFWSFMADLYSKEQSRRLFGFIATGASAGASIGPLVAGQAVSYIGSDNLILLAAAMLILPIATVFLLQRSKATEGRNEKGHADPGTAKIGGNPLAGFRTFVTSPYLLAIGLFILLYTTIGSFVYFEQVELLRDFTREERTAILATLAAVVNLLTFGLGLFLTSRIVTRLGMTTALAVVPVVVCAGLIVLALAPILTVLLVLQVVRQGGNYGVTRPAREMLFTNLDRETRFKAKPVTDGLGLGVAAMAGIGAGLAAVWVGAGVYLGRAFRRHSAVVPGAKQTQDGAIARPAPVVVP